MKRLLSLLGMLIVALSTFAQTFTVDDLTYYVTSTTDKTVRVSDGKNATGDVVVPEVVTYNDIEYSVTEIGSQAFSQNKNITSVSMPSVTSIGSSAFYYCSSLFCIAIPEGVSVIDNYTFCGCSRLGSVVIPNSVTAIGKRAFDDCSYLNTVVLGSSLSVIDVQAFYNDSRIKDVICYGETSASFLSSENFNRATRGEITLHVPEGCYAEYNRYWGFTGKIVEDAAEWSAYDSYMQFGKCGDNIMFTIDFDGMLDIKGTGEMSSLGNESSIPWYTNRANIKNVRIAEGVKTIRSYAFYGCSSLTVINIPESVANIGEYAFNGCSSLTAISLPENVESILLGTFGNCSSLNSITIPNDVTNIGNSSFRNCSSLTSIVIPESATNIDIEAFAYCSSLTSITIPKNVTEIAPNAFRGCTSLESIFVDEANTVYDSRDNCNAIIKKSDNSLFMGFKNTIIPNSVTRIGNNAFWECGASLIIPNSVTSIGKSAFYYCNSLVSIFIPESVAEIENYAFGDYLCDIYYSGTEIEWNSIEGVSYIPSTTTIHYSTKLVHSIMLNAESETLKVDETIQLTALVVPDDATNRLVTWKTSDANVATVDENGLVTAIASGMAVITATLTDISGVSANCEITVKDLSPEHPIVDDGNYTDITEHDNIVFFNEARQWPGKQITLPLMMNNAAEITAMQFDLVLPEGITLDKNAREKYALTFNAEAERTDASVHTLSSSMQADGSIRVLCYSIDKEAFLGNSGALIDFPLTIAADVEPAEYDIVLKNIILTATDKKEYKMDEVICKLIVPDYEMGDVNSDGEINVTDIVYVSDYILGNTDPDFNELAADMNEDNEINVTDIVYIADKILSGEEGANAKSMAKGHAAGSAMMKIDSFSMAAGNSKTVTLDMQNEGKEIVAFQCNIILPEGMSINSGIAFNEAANRTDAYTHSLATSQKDGRVKVVCYSLGNDSFLGTEGAILSLPVMADAMMADGKYDIKVENIVMTCKDKTQLKPADVTATVSVGGTTAINMQGVTPDASAGYYNVGGQQLGNARKGISIIRTDTGVGKVLR